MLHKDVSRPDRGDGGHVPGHVDHLRRCHNHPLEKWTQDQYWAMANLFAAVGMKNGDRAGEVIVQSRPTATRCTCAAASPMPPTPLDGKPLPLDDTGRPPGATSPTG